MKKYIVEFFVSAILFLSVSVGIDAIIGRLNGAGYYLVSALVFGLLFPLCMTLYDKIKHKK